MTKAVILLGAGGHARVVIDAFRLCGGSILGILDKNQTRGEVIYGDLEILGGDEMLSSYSPDKIDLINGLGSLPGNSRRADIFQKFCEKGYQFRTIIHPSAIVASDVELSQGVQIMAGAVVQPGTVIGANTIINTRASIDHDCVIGNNCHIAPGATLSGDVSLGDGVHIGTGAALIQSVAIANNSVVGAGAVITKNIPQGCIVYPALSVIEKIGNNKS